MRRASSPSLPKALPPAQAARLPRRLRRWLLQFAPQLDRCLSQAARTTGADAGRRRCFARGHAYFLLYHALSGSPSLRQSYVSFAAQQDLARVSGLASAEPDGGLSVSFSQLALSNTTRPAAFLASINAALLPRVAPRLDWPLPFDVHVLDATFLYLSATLAGGWLPLRQRPHASGVKAQIDYTPRRDLPSLCLLTSSTVPDCRALDQALLDDPAALAARRTETLVFDLGYYSHQRFARLKQAGVHFVTRLQGQALVTVEAEQPVQAPLPLAVPLLLGGQSGITVLRDCRVRLGSSNNRVGDCVAPLRLVTARVPPGRAAGRQGKQPQEYTILTDRFDLPAATVVLIYRYRWQIELCFLWLKEHLHLDQLLGSSRNAVLLSIELAFLVHLLCLLAAQDLALPGRTPPLKAVLAAVFLQLPFSEALLQCPVQLALPFANAPPCK